MPYQSDIHIDQALTTVSIAYKNDGYVADVLLPSVPVDKRSDLYFVYGKEAFKRRDDLVRPGSIAPQLERTLSRDSYVAERHAQRELVTDSERSESDNPLNADVDTTELLTDAVMNNREFAVLAMMTDPAQLTQNVTLAGTTQWSDYVNSTPLTNIKTAKSAVRLGVLKEATDFTISYDGALTLADHPSVKELIKYTDPGNIGSSGLPSTLRGLKVNEAGAFIDNTNVGQTPQFATAFGNNCLIHYTTRSAGLKTITLGYMFEAPDETTGARGFSTIRYREEARHGEWIEVSSTYALKLVAPLGGYLMLAVQ
jgi:hypothetical protein